MKAFESTAGLTYPQAVANCRNISAEIAQPLNPVDSATLYAALTNDTTLTDKSFWIGLFIYFLLNILN
jgi:hypothetical protein